MNPKQVKQDALDSMWTFLQMGNMKADYSRLKDYCIQLRRMMMQKTAGQDAYKKSDDIPFSELEAVENGIIIEAMALVFSGEMEKEG